MLGLSIVIDTCMRVVKTLITVALLSLAYVYISFSLPTILGTKEGWHAPNPGVMGGVSKQCCGRKATPRHQSGVCGIRGESEKYW